MSWQDNILTNPTQIVDVLKQIKTIAVLGIKPESRASQAAHYVPAYLQEQGYDIIPVPTYYPDVEVILGQAVQRDLAQIEGEVDMVNVFRKPDDIPAHVDKLLALAPRVVWFQLGIEHDESAKTLAEHGIQVIQNRCALADHKHFGIGKK